MTIDDIRHELQMAQVRANVGKRIGKRFPRDYMGSQICPMYFKTAAEEQAYIEVRRRVLDLCPARFDTAAEEHAYTKVLLDLVANGIPTPEDALLERFAAEKRLNSACVGLDFTDGDICPTRFETREEMVAYIEVRRQLCGK